MKGKGSLSMKLSRPRRRTCSRAPKVDESADGCNKTEDDEEMIPKREKRVMVDDELRPVPAQGEPVPCADFKRKRAEESTSSGDVTSVNDDVTMQVRSCRTWRIWVCSRDLPRKNA